eukprot:UN08384
MILLLFTAMILGVEPEPLEQVGQQRGGSQQEISVHRDTYLDTFRGGRGTSIKIDLPNPFEETGIQTYYDEWYKELKPVGSPVVFPYFDTHTGKMVYEENLAEVWKEYLGTIRVRYHELLAAPQLKKTKPAEGSCYEAGQQKTQACTSVQWLCTCVLKKGVLGYVDWPDCLWLGIVPDKWP